MTAPEDFERELLRLNQQEIAFIKNFKSKLAAVDQHSRAIAGVILLISNTTEVNKRKIQKYTNFIKQIQEVFLEEFKAEELLKQGEITTAALVGELITEIDSVRAHLEDINPSAIRDQLLFILTDLEEQRTKIYSTSHDGTFVDTSEKTLTDINIILENLFEKLKENITLIRAIFEAENISLQEIQTSTRTSELVATKMVLLGQKNKFDLLINELKESIIKPLLGFLHEQRIIIHKVIEVSAKKRITKRVIERDLRNCSSPQEKLEYLQTLTLLLDRIYQPDKLRYFIYDEMKKAQRDLKRISAEITIDRIRIEKEVIMELDWGIFNKKGYNRFLPLKIREALRDKQKLCLLMMDIDNFKGFNDTFGHTSGDEALKFVAITIRDRLRAGEEAFRFGGEEFAVLFKPGTPINKALTVAERLRTAIEKNSEGVMTEIKRVTNRTGDRDKITISGGIACFSPTTKNQPIDESVINKIAYELKEEADKALYEAKKLGRNNIQKSKTIVEMI